MSSLVRRKQVADPTELQRRLVEALREVGVLDADQPTAAIGSRAAATFLANLLTKDEAAWLPTRFRGPPVAVDVRTMLAVLLGRSVTSGSQGTVKSGLDDIEPGLGDLKWVPAQARPSRRSASHREPEFWESLDRLALRHLYVGPQDNERRNGAKSRLLDPSEGIRRDAGETIVLLAQTGYSYLAHGVRFRPAVERFLASHELNRFEVHLLDPCSEATLALCLNWMRAAREPRVEHFGKLGAALLGFRNLFESHTNQVALRFTPFDQTATMLASSEACFVEPYLRCDPARRASQHLTSHELELSRSSSGSDPDELGSHVEFHRRYGVSLHRWVASWPRHQESVMARIVRLAEDGVIRGDEADTLRRTYRDPDWLRILKPDTAPSAATEARSRKRSARSLGASKGPSSSGSRPGKGRRR